MIRFYFHPTPNPAKVALFLEETGLPYEVIAVDTSEGEQHTPAFRAINPNGKVPAIVDMDGPGGKEARVFGSGSLLAILVDAAHTAADRLRRYFTVVAERSAACAYSAGCLVGSLSVELAGQDTLIVGHLAAVLDAWTKAIEDCLLEARAAGQLRCDRDPALVARLLVNALQGAILRTKVEKSGTAFTDLEAFGGATVLV